MWDFIPITLSLTSVGARGHCRGVGSRMRRLRGRGRSFCGRGLLGSGSHRARCALVRVCRVFTFGGGGHSAKQYIPLAAFGLPVSPTATPTRAQTPRSPCAAFASGRLVPPRCLSSRMVNRRQRWPQDSLPMLLNQDLRQLLRELRAQKTQGVCRGPDRCGNDLDRDIGKG